MKFMHLVFRQYSKYLLRELIIVAFAAYMIYALTMAVTPIAYTLKAANQVRENIRQNAIYFSPFDRATRIADGILYNTDEEMHAMERLLNQSLDEISGVIGQGKTGQITFTNEGQGFTNLVIYNDDMIRYTKLPLSDGKWFSGDDMKPSAVPVVIGGSMKGSYKVGDNFQLVLKEKYNTNIDCLVIGILDETDTYINLGYGASLPNISSLATMNQWTYTGSSMGAAGCALIIAPQTKLPFSDASDISRGALLFFDEKMNTGSLAQNLEADGKYGHYFPIERIFQNQYQYDISLHANEIVLSMVLFMFNLLGLGGYTLLSQIRNEYTMSIYFLCGMSKRKALTINLAATGFLVLVPAIVMTLFSPRFVLPGSLLNHTTYVISLLTVVVILSASSLISIFRIIRFNPTKLAQMEG